MMTAVQTVFRAHVHFIEHTGMMFMPIALALCRVRYREPELALAVSSITTVYSAHFSQPKQSQFVYGLQFEFSVGSSKGGFQKSLKPSWYRSQQKQLDIVTTQHEIGYGLLNKASVRQLTSVRFSAHFSIRCLGGEVLAHSNGVHREPQPSFKEYTWECGLVGLVGRRDSVRAPLLYEVKGQCQ